jgi:hypothetical protein
MGRFDVPFVGDSGVGVCILRRGLPSFASLAQLFPPDGKSSMPSPAGSLQGVSAHMLVELAALHYWVAEGAAGLNGRGFV